MTGEQALAQLAAAGDPARAATMAARHKIARPYLGTPDAVLDDLARDWRAALTLNDRLALAESLWRSNVHEARLAAAKLLTQARIRPDDAAAWALIQTWVPDLDSWALTEQVATAGQKRLVADPARLDDVEDWITAPRKWARCAALLMTLPWTRQNNPKPADLEIRDRLLGWCADLAEDRDGAVQQALASWLRALARHDAPRARAFLADQADRSARPDPTPPEDNGP